MTNTPMTRFSHAAREKASKMAGHLVEYVLLREHGRPQPSRCLRDRSRDLPLVGDVGNHGNRLVPCGLEGTGKGRRGIPVLVENGHSRTLCRRPLNGGAADSTGTAGDQHRRIGESGWRRRGHAVAFLARPIQARLDKRMNP